MDRSGIKGTMDVSVLLNSLKSDKIYKHQDEVMGYITDMIATRSSNIEVPSTLFISNICKEYADEMISLYNGTFGLYDGVNKVPDSIKILQASVIDSICFGYDTGKEVANLYTLKLELFGDSIDDKELDKAMKSNLQGRIHAYKLSYEYKNCDNVSIDYKLGSHRTVIDDDECVLVPLMVSEILLGVLKKFMDSGLVVKVGQEVSNGTKVRCVTDKIEILSKYCDMPDAVVDLKSKYYVLDGFFYAPVIGAPSTTCMMTLIDMFRISELKRIQNAKQLAEYGVQKSKDPVGEEIINNLITEHVLMLAADEGTEEFEQFIQGMPSQDVLGTVNRENISKSLLTRYFHSIKNSERREILKKIPGSKAKYDAKKSVYGSSLRDATEDEVKDIKTLLENHLCRIIIRKKDGTYSNMTCTNSKEILAKVYGEDYFGIYESFGVRARRVAFEIAEGKTSNDEISDLLEKYGFDVDVSVLLDVVKTYGDLSRENVLKALYGIYDKKEIDRNTGDMILARGIDAMFNYKKGTYDEYYKYIDREKIQKVVILD